MKNTFSEVKRFQVKPDKIEAFEDLIIRVADNQKLQEGCINIKYMKRFFTIDGAKPGSPPRELTRIVKCMNYYAYWEFDDKKNYGAASKWFFDTYYKELAKLLVAPFDIYCGDSIY